MTLAIAQTDKNDQCRSKRPRLSLIDAEYLVCVEVSPDRIYKDSEFKAVGAEIVPAGSWVDAPLDNVILGLKELPADHSLCPLLRDAGWMGHGALALRQGQGSTLRPGVPRQRERSAHSSFGSSAGYSGAALALLSWAPACFSSVFGSCAGAREGGRMDEGGKDVSGASC